ncbi:MAG: GNAT family N-acetyltransferase [Chloroflexota bacterium]
MVITLNRKHEENGLRPLIPSKDLQGVATLIEAVFSSELDQAGRLALREMHRMGRWGFLLGLADYINPDVNTHLNGFVWVENGEIVGNVTVSRNSPLSKHWFISNVAVSEAYRQQGIARALMIAAIEFVKEMRGYEISLQVRQGNTPAINLYQSFGFRMITATSYLHLPRITNVVRQNFPSTLKLRPHKLNLHDSSKAYALARLSIPTNIQAERPLRQSQFRLSKPELRFNNFWRRLVGLGEHQHYVVEQASGNFVATVDIIAGAWRQDHKISFLVHPDWWGKLEMPLIHEALSYLASYKPKPITLQHPAEHEAGIDACKQLGFREQRTHIWMKLTV